MTDTNPTPGTPLPGMSLWRKSCDAYEDGAAGRIDEPMRDQVIAGDEAAAAVIDAEIAALVALKDELVGALDFMVNVSRSTPGFSAMAREQAERALAKARGEG